LKIDKTQEQYSQYIGTTAINAIVYFGPPAVKKVIIGGLMKHNVNFDKQNPNQGTPITQTVITIKNIQFGGDEGEFTYLG